VVPNNEKYHSFVFKVFEHLRNEDKDRTDFVAFDAALIARFKQLMSKIEIMESNLKFILDRNNNPKDREQFVQLFTTMCTGIISAYTVYAQEILVGKESKERLKDLLNIDGVPKFIYDKFTAKMNLDTGSELFKILFPSTIQKGMTLTVAEWRSKGFMKMLPDWLLDNSRALRMILQDDHILRPLCGIHPDISLDDISNDKVRILLESKIFVVPPAKTPDYVIDAGLKGRIRVFPLTSMTGVKEVMSSLSIFFMRLYSGRLNVPDPVVEYGRLIIPDEFDSAGIGPGNGLYHQWKASPNKTAKWLRLIKCEAEMRVEFDRLFRRHVPTSTATNQRLHALIIEDPVIRDPPLPVIEPSEFTVKIPDFDLIEPLPLVVRLEPEYKLYSTLYSEPGKRKEVKGFIQSRLTKRTKQNLLILKAGTDPAVIEIVEAYLRSFVSEEIQEAASKVLLSTFDKLIQNDESEGELGDESSSENEEV